MNNSVGIKIKSYRRAKGYSGEQLGSIVGLTSSAIYSYEKGIAEPPLTVLEKIATALGVTTADLLGHANSNLNSELERLQKENAWLRQLVERLTEGPRNTIGNFLSSLTQAAAEIAGVRASVL